MFGATYSEQPKTLKSLIFFINKRTYKQTMVQSENRMVFSNIKEQTMDTIAKWINF